MKDTALLLNPKYKDQGMQTNISFDNTRGTFVTLETPRANKYTYCQFIDPWTAHNKTNVHLLSCTSITTELVSPTGGDIRLNFLTQEG